MGTIIWQLNDCWSTASWSMIDYEGRQKAVQYYAKRFFAPLMIFSEEEGILTQNQNINAEPYELKKSIRLCVANETKRVEEMVVRWSFSFGRFYCAMELNRLEQNTERRLYRHQEGDTGARR